MNRRKTIILRTVSVFFCLMVWTNLPSTAQTIPDGLKETQAEQDARMAWWREARFGMFIHWGLYAVPAGTWKDYKDPGIGEWIMNHAKIPVNEYEQLARRFNPVKFDADEWVKIAKDAGMKYLVITSKHHDGFAMYDSRVSDYNIVKATPFKRDPLKELEVACKKEGIKLCFYYSHVRDWHHPDAPDNTWDYDPAKQNFANYYYGKSMPQVSELIQQYHPALIWFDTPINATREQSLAMKALVRALDPGILVSGRIGNNVGDYMSMGDNAIPPGVVPGDWETPATLNNTWGYKDFDLKWKSTTELLRLLVDIVSKGGNYLLNVGPTAEGVIPQPSVDRLREIGTWLKVNGDAVYGTKASPYPWEFPWGAITTKSGKLYFSVFEWPKGALRLSGLKNKVKKAYLLADPEQKPLVVKQTLLRGGLHRMEIGLPEKPADPMVSVIAVDLEGNVDVDTTPVQEADGLIRLEGVAGRARKDTAAAALRFTGRGGGAERWMDPGIVLSWKFNVLKPGEYAVQIVSSEAGSHGNPLWVAGHKVGLSTAGQTLAVTIADDGRTDNPRSLYWKLVQTNAGKVRFGKAGLYTLDLKPAEINQDKNLGFTFRAVKLVPLK